MEGVEDFVLDLQRGARNNLEAVELACRLLEIAGEKFTPMVFHATFRRAFSVPLTILQQASSWSGFAFGDIDDEMFDSLLSPYIKSWVDGDLESLD